MARISVLGALTRIWTAENDLFATQPNRLSLGNGKQRVKIPLQLHKFVETALLGDAAVFQREQAGASAQDILVEIMSNDDARIPYSRAVKEQMLDGKLTEAVNDREFNEKFKAIVDKIVG